MTVLRSRSGHWALFATFAMCTLAAITGRRAIEIDLSASFPPTKLVLVELCVIVTATLLTILTRPRFWEWDRIARGHRPHTVAGTVAAATTALSALCVPAVVPWLPTTASWTWVLANALVLSATVHLTSALLNPLLAGALTLVFWFGSAVVTNLAPHVWLPLANYRDPNGRWTAAALLVTAAVTLHARTCGATTWSHRQFNKER
jgi:hypothetical protein